MRLLLVSLFASGCGASVTSAVCGDQSVEGAETCDDGNTVDGDGCTAACSVERCGDAVVDVGEGCDDGNATEGDGCDSN